MKCLCPNCGKKVDSEKLGFDFTDFIQKKIKQILSEGGSKPETVQIASESEKFFNYWKEKRPFLVSEDDLWNLPEPKDAAMGVHEKDVIYKLPYREIRNRLEREEGNFKKWMIENEEKIMNKDCFLMLKKDGGGEIRVNRIREINSDWKGIDKRQCPECHGVMSYWSGRYPEICLTVLGGPRVSKSSTLTACAFAFSDAGGSICWEGSIDDESYVAFDENYLSRYREGKPPRATNVDYDTIPRLTFKVRIDNRNICLTFIDLPGEFNNKKGIDGQIYNKYKNFYDNIDFVWYCTDPGEVMQLEGEAQHREEIMALGYEADQEVIKLPRLLSNMRNLAGFFTPSGRKVPVVYILGKTDLDIISSQDKEEFGLYKQEESDIELPLDIRQFCGQARKVKNYIEKYNPAMIKTLEENFENRFYFAISAYGYNPKNEKNIENGKKPYHCTWPFYWMLALENCIDVRVTAETRRFGKRHREEFIDKLGNLPKEIKRNVLYNLYMHGPYKI